MKMEMTNAEAIDLLEGVRKGLEGRLGTALDMAVDALKEKAEADSCANGACMIHFKKEGQN